MDPREPLLESEDALDQAVSDLDVEELRRRAKSRRSWSTKSRKTNSKRKTTLTRRATRPFRTTPRSASLTAIHRAKAALSTRSDG